MNLEQVGKFLIAIAVIIGITGILIFLIGKGLGLSKLPGDIFIKRDGWGIFFPIATSILISLVLTVVLNVILWLMRR